VRNEVEYEGKHEPIVSKELWLRVRGELKGRGELSILNKKHNHPLKGIVHCACGRKMTMDAGKNKYRYFVCRGREKCDQPGVPAEVVDEHIPGNTG
jgi:hypothetical protein